MSVTAYPRAMGILKDTIMRSAGFGDTSEDAFNAAVAAAKERNIEASRQFEQNRRNEASALAKSYESTQAPPRQQVPPDTISIEYVKDSGGWIYEDLGGGKVRIVTAPPGSKAAGKVLDPSKIAAITDPVARARVQRAYDSIKSVMSGGEALTPYRAPAKKTPAQTIEKATPVDVADSAPLTAGRGSVATGMVKPGATPLNKPRS
jgi:hypothetical protein